MELIEQEQKKYEEIVREKNAKKRQELIQKLKENEQTYNYSKYKTKYLKQVIEDEIMKKEQQIMKSEKRQQYREKCKEFDDYVKEKYKPITSLKKQDEINKIKEELMMNPKEKVRRLSPMIHSDKDGLTAIAKKRREIFQWENSLKPPTPPPKREFEKIDYLKEFQTKRESEFERTGKTASMPSFRTINIK